MAEARIVAAQKVPPVFAPYGAPHAKDSFAYGYNMAIADIGRALSRDYQVPDGRLTWCEKCGRTVLFCLHDNDGLDF